jgi:hypothetical protein
VSRKSFDSLSYICAGALRMFHKIDNIVSSDP